MFQHENRLILQTVFEKRILTNPSDTIAYRDTANAGHLHLPQEGTADTSAVVHVAANVSGEHLRDTMPTEKFITATDTAITQITPKVIAESPSGDTTAILSGVLFLAALLHFADRHLYGKLFRYLDISHPAHQQQSVGEMMPIGFRIVLFAMIPLVYSVFIVLIFSKFNIQPYIFQSTDYHLIFSLYAIIFAYLTSKYIIIRFSGTIFKTLTISKKYNAGQFVFNVITSILLLPVLWALPYDKSFATAYLAVSIYIVLFIFRMMRNAFVAKEEDKYSLFHFFIYFCTLEILPVLLLVKVFLNYNRL